MLLPLSLRARLVVIFLAMLLMVLIFSASMVWNTYQVSTKLNAMIHKDLILYETTRKLELALANQKGYLTYFFMDGNDKWLESLDFYQQMFRQNLDGALALGLDDQQKTTLIQIEQLYSQYQKAKTEAIELYRSNSSPEILYRLHEKRRGLFFSLLESCDSFSTTQRQIILEAQTSAVARSKLLIRIALGSSTVFLILCALLSYVLYRQILGPLRELVIKTGGSSTDSVRDEVVSLSDSLNGIMKDIDETHHELTKSRRNLLNAERMAVVGELAAGVAHTIRNPLTSIKMRTFSLSNSLNPNKDQNEDLQVISAEIDRIDKIVRNFIEFARPPKLALEKHSLEELVRSVNILMKYRLSRYNVEIVYDFEPGLGKIVVDGDRIKEALLNLITNSCEAMQPGGKIRISESRENDRDIGEAAVLTIKDDGHGIPESIVDKITIPFFTTKEEGSGLGLSTVARIVQEHGGKLVIEPVDAGCEIIIKLPV